MKRPINIFNSKIPKMLSIFIDISAITIWPFVIYRAKEEDLKGSLLNHEAIHIRQQEELWVIGFYILYVYYWLKNFLYYQHSSHAYYNIPFEIEAYKNQYNYEYLETREPHSWLKYRDDEIVS